jgi:hypothetical protein
MRKITLFILLALIFAGRTGFAQGSVTMKIAQVTPSKGEDIIAFEADGAATPPTGGVGAGKPTLENIRIQKNLSISSQLIRDMLKGTRLPTVEFDFTDNAGKLTYKVILTNAGVTKFTYLSPACPSCQKLTNEIWFSFQKISYVDVTNNITTNFDPATGIVN